MTRRNIITVAGFALYGLLVAVAAALAPWFVTAAVLAAGGLAEVCSHEMQVG